MDHFFKSVAAPEWHNHAVQYATEVGDKAGIKATVERFDAGRSFENDLARIRYVKNELVLIAEFNEASELFVDNDGDAISFAFIKADPFDGSAATLTIEKIRQAFRLKGAEASD